VAVSDCCEVVLSGCELSKLYCEVGDLAVKGDAAWLGSLFYYCCVSCFFDELSALAFSVVGAYVYYFFCA
jgi:hypothetical protein